MELLTGTLRYLILIILISGLFNRVNTLYDFYYIYVVDPNEINIKKWDEY